MIPKIAIITGPKLSHRYIVNNINREFPIDFVLIEQLAYPEFSLCADRDRIVWEWFFNRVAAYEKKVFADSDRYPKINQPKTIHIPKGQLNSPATIDILHTHNPDIIILFACSLLGKEILESFPGRIFNIHIGISGEYRGSSCNFWPIHDERLDCLGATLLAVNAGIDTGEIIAQRTISIEENDSEQPLMGKSLMLGVRLVIEFLRNESWKNWKPLPLKRNGKLCTKSDLTPKAISKVKRMVEEGHLQDLIRIHLKSGKTII